MDALQDFLNELKVITEVEQKHSINPNNIKEVEVELLRRYSPPSFDTEGEEIMLSD